jgi:hypothetical protein
MKRKTENKGVDLTAGSVLLGFGRRGRR